MSGMEVAGLVLSTISVVDSAVKIYGSLLHFKGTSAVQYEVRNMIKEIETERLIVSHTLEMLLYPSVSPEEIDELLSHPASLKWKSLEIEAAVKETLGAEGYTVFVHSLRQLFENMDALGKSINALMEKNEAGSFPSRQKLKWVFNKNRTQESLVEVKRCNVELETLAHRSVYIQQFRRSNQAIRNINDASIKIGNIQRVAEAVEALVTGEDTLSSDTNDASSMYTVETEADSEGEGVTLSYLSLSLEALNGSSTTLLTKDALLDTGASASAISMTLARELQLDIEDDEETTEIRTAVLNQTLRTAGRAQVKMRWKDGEDKPKGTKIWVHIVYGLSQPILLSHDFTHNHREVWDVAKKKNVRSEEFQILWFGDKSKEEQKQQNELREKRMRENKAKAEANSDGVTLKERSSTQSQPPGSPSSRPSPGPSSGPAPTTTGGSGPSATSG